VLLYRVGLAGGWVGLAAGAVRVAMPYRTEGGPGNAPLNGFEVNNAKGGLPPFQLGKKISVFELANFESRTRQRSMAV
jgi:hypothetical protein